MKQLLKMLTSTLPKGGSGKLDHFVEIWNMGTVERQVPGAAEGVTATDSTGGAQVGEGYLGLKPMKSKTAEDVRNGVEDNLQYYEFTLRFRSDITTQYEFREPATNRVFEIKQLYDGFQNRGHLSGVLQERLAGNPAG